MAMHLGVLLVQGIDYVSYWTPSLLVPRHHLFFIESYCVLRTSCRKILWNLGPFGPIAGGASLF